MLTNTIYNQSVETLGTGLPDGLDYFLLFLLFFGVIVGVIVVIYFAKWLTMGPKLKARWAKITGKSKGPAVVDGVQVKGKEIIVDANYEENLRKMIEEAHSPQEKLDYQSKLDAHIKQREKVEREIKEAEAAKLAKIQEKEELARIQREAKEEAKKLKEQNK